MQEILFNLIDNAIKFRCEDNPRITISTRNTPHEYELIVSDNGIGIDSKHQRDVFEPFTRVHGETYSGCGIGLSIVRAAVERLRGSVTVSSNPDGGVTFKTTVPTSCTLGGCDRQPQELRSLAAS